MELNRDIAKKVLAVVDAGLVRGLGHAKPGEMCVEAAVCYALGEPHSDSPSCVSAAVRAPKITLNDACWSSNAARTAGMRAVAIAQLGSKDIDQTIFARFVAEQTIRHILPITLRAAGLNVEADRCEREGTGQSAGIAQFAAANATAAYAAATAAAYAAVAGTAAALTGVGGGGAGYATEATAAAARVTAYAAIAAANAAARATAHTAAYAAYAANAADAVLLKFSGILVEGLKRAGSLGCQWLDIL